MAKRYAREVGPRLSPTTWGVLAGHPCRSTPPGGRRDPAARERYVEAFERSDFEAMLNYYKANYPREPYTAPAKPPAPVKCPVLMIHGLDDKALLAPALNGTWEFLEKDLTLVTVPGAGHFVQQDASELVSRSIKMWLGR